VPGLSNQSIVPKQIREMGLSVGEVFVMKRKGVIK